MKKVFTFLGTLFVLFVVSSEPAIAQDRPIREVTIITLIRGTGEPGDEQLHSIVSDMLELELEGAGLRVLSEEDLRENSFPDGLPEFSRTVLMQELARLTEGDFLLETVLTSGDEDIRLDFYLADLQSQDVVTGISRQNVQDIFLDRAVASAVDELIPVLSNRIARQAPDGAGTLGLGRPSPPAPPPEEPTPPPEEPTPPPEEEPAPPPEEEPEPPPEEPTPPPEEPTPPPEEEPTPPPEEEPEPPPEEDEAELAQAPPVPTPPPSPPPPEPEPVLPGDEARILARTPAGPFQLSAGFSPFLVLGRATEYYQIGYQASLYGTYCQELAYGCLELGFFTAVQMFRAEGLIASSDNLLIPFGPELRLEFALGRSWSMYLRGSGGPAVISMDITGDQRMSKLLPYASAGVGLGVAFSRSIGLALDVNYIVFFEEMFPIMGLSPTLALTFRM